MGSQEIKYPLLLAADGLWKATLQRIHMGGSFGGGQRQSYQPMAHVPRIYSEPNRGQ